MEKNLNLRKLFLMYLRNLWIIILVGIIFAGVAFVAKRTVWVIKPYLKRLRLPLKFRTAWTRAHIQSAPFILIITEACWQATR